MDRPPVDRSEVSNNPDPLHHVENATIASDIDTFIRTKAEYPLVEGMPKFEDEMEFGHDDKPSIFLQRLTKKTYIPHNRVEHKAPQDLPKKFITPLFSFTHHIDIADEQVLQSRIQTPQGPYPPFIRANNGNVYSFSESFFVDRNGTGARVVSAEPFNYWDHVAKKDPIAFDLDDLIQAPFVPNTKTDTIMPISDEERKAIQEELQEIRDGTYKRAF